MFPKRFRLRKKEDYHRLFKKGKRIRGSFLDLQFIKNNFSFYRVAVIVSLKVSKKATVRNKLKRRSREALKKILEGVGGYDIALIVKENAKEKNFQEILDEITRLFKKAKII